jgi:hypothetical protein
MLIYFSMDPSVKILNIIQLSQININFDEYLIRQLHINEREVYLLLELTKEEKVEAKHYAYLARLRIEDLTIPESTDKINVELLKFNLMIFEAGLVLREDINWISPDASVLTNEKVKLEFGKYKEALESRHNSELDPIFDSKQIEFDWGRVKIEFSRIYLQDTVLED